MVALVADVCVGGNNRGIGTGMKVPTNPNHILEAASLQQCKMLFSVAHRVGCGVDSGQNLILIVSFAVDVGDRPAPRPSLRFQSTKPES